MTSKIFFSLKQILKMLLQNVILPTAYNFWLIIYRNEMPDLIVFADAHNNQLPYSMERMYDSLNEKGYTIISVIHDFSSLSILQSALISIRFMRIYARAKYVFICDNFLPVVSCNKRKETVVIQLMHSCGLLKKIGYDTTEDIPKGYRGSVYKNYTIVTVSSPECVPHLEKAMRLDSGIVQPLGVSRSDNYFDPNWIDDCKKSFFVKYPELKNKKIILWAPTFRGNAGSPYQVGIEAIEELEKKLGADYFVLKKVHPHVDKKYLLSNCDISTEKLFPVIDLLISDYSSVVNEFMFFKKPYVLFAPDLSCYEEARGFYIPYNSLSPYVCTEEINLYDNVIRALKEDCSTWIQEQYVYHLSSCNGNSTNRILQFLNL